MRFLSNITQLSYSAEELRRCFRAEDLWKFSIKKSAINTEIQKIANDFEVEKFKIRHLQTSHRKKHTVFSTDSLHDTLCIRRTDQILRRAFRTPLLTRHDMVRQLIELIKTEPNANIFRTDIKGFFESTSLKEVISKLETAGFRNYCVLQHLRELNSYLEITHSHRGLPRGLSISSTLAEYSLRAFDRSLLEAGSVLFYGRYVDDICVLHFNEPVAMEELVREALGPTLELNLTKTRHLQSQKDQRLEFLGYEIQLAPSGPITRISEKKIDRAKKRIILSLRGFLADLDFGKLRDRLRFLSSNTKMTMAGRSAPVFTGYRFVYPLCTPSAVKEQMRQLDMFLRGVLISNRFYLSRKLQLKLSREQWEELKNMSFERGFQEAANKSMTPSEIAEIKRVWSYE